MFSKSIIKKTSYTSDDRELCFSPAGKKFCFASHRNGNYDIFVMNVERGFSKTQITTSFNDEILPNWSPRGNLIAFFQFSNTARDWYIWTKNLENGQFTQICQGINPIFFIHGKQIYYKESREKYFELWRIDFDEKNDTQLIANSKWGVGCFSVSADERYIIYSSLKGFYSNKYNVKRSNDGVDLWGLNLQSGAQIQVTMHKAPILILYGRQLDMSFLHPRTWDR